MTLKFKHFAMEYINQRSNKDGRRKVNAITATYEDGANNEYRKRFEFPTHIKLDDARKWIPDTIDTDEPPFKGQITIHFSEMMQNLGA